MVSDDVLRKQLQFTLERTNFENLGERYEGKVRDNYSLGDRRILITTDRLSAFDRVLTTIPSKGQVLNEISVYWFNATKDVAANHLVESPDPNVMVAKQCKTIPVEMVVRGYLTGSAWRDYQAGKDISGIAIPTGLKNWQKFDKPLVTPSTKAESGLHDEHISKEKILQKGIVKRNIYEKMQKASLDLYSKGAELCRKNGLILVDTKYEFGITAENELLVVDEMHTPDSSRFWYAESYEEKFSKGEEPDILDKEYLRQWLIRERNFMGDGPCPDIPDEVRVETARRYIKAFEMITGRELEARNESPLERIKKNLKERGYLKD